MVIRLDLRTLITAAILAAGVAANPAGAGQIHVAWDPVPGATGYKVYAGTSSGVYGSPVTSSTTSAVLTNLADCQTWYVAVKAYNSAGESSQFSNELSGWPRPSVTAASPASILQGAQATIEITGANFQAGAAVEIDNIGVSPASVRVLSCNRMQLLATIEPTAENVRAAEVGRFTVSVVNPDSVFGSRSEAFEVAINPARFDINKTDDATRGRIDGKDTVWLARLFGSREGTSSYDPDSDFDGDGWVDGVDLAHIASNLGRCWSGTAWTVAACPASLQ
jgi:hypothetical protein